MSEATDRDMTEEEYAAYENSPDAERDAQAIAASFAEGNAPEMKLTHTLLEIWQAFLSNIDSEAAAPLSPSLALRFLRLHPELKAQEIPTYLDYYYNLLRAIRDILNDRIEKNPDALKNIEDDAEKNRVHYLDIMFEWQAELMTWDFGFDVMAPDAVPILCAISDAKDFVVGEKGLFAHLSNPVFNMPFDAEDREAMHQRLTEFREEQGE